MAPRGGARGRTPRTASSMVGRQWPEARFRAVSPRGALPFDVQPPAQQPRGVREDASGAEPPPVRCDSRAQGGREPALGAHDVRASRGTAHRGAGRVPKTRAFFSRSLDREARRVQSRARHRDFPHRGRGGEAPGKAETGRRVRRAGVPGESAVGPRTQVRRARLRAGCARRRRVRVRRRLRADVHHPVHGGGPGRPLSAPHQRRRAAKSERVREARGLQQTLVRRVSARSGRRASGASGAGPIAADRLREQRVARDRARHRVRARRDAGMRDSSGRGRPRRTSESKPRPAGRDVRGVRFGFHVGARRVAGADRNKHLPGAVSARRGVADHASQDDGGGVSPDPRLRVPGPSRTRARRVRGKPTRRRGRSGNSALSSTSPSLQRADRRGARPVPEAPGSARRPRTRARKRARSARKGTGPIPPRERVERVRLRALEGEKQVRAYILCNGS